MRRRIPRPPPVCLGELAKWGRAAIRSGVRLALIVLALVALIVVGAVYFHRAKPSIAAVALKSGLTASGRVTDGEIADDDALTDDYWRGQGFAMAHLLA